jgi:hypothetical protein
MRGRERAILVMVTLIAIITTLAHAQEFAIPVEKSSCFGITSVKFDGIEYRILTNDLFDIAFSKEDETHVRMFVFPRRGMLMPYHTMSVQWGEFPAVNLPLGEGDSDSFLLGSETGYAEK